MTSTVRPHFFTLVLLSALAVLPVNMFLPSLPHIANTFQADFALVSIAVSGYAIVAALTQLIAGPVLDRYGRRPVVLLILIVFSIASIGCALATDIGTFLFFRLAQAVVAACYAISLAIIKETSGDREAASKIGYVATAWAVAPMIGPAFGGLLDELYGWRANFVAFALFGIALFILSVFNIEKATTLGLRTAADYIKGYKELLTSLRFWAYTLCMAFSTGTLYVFLTGAPLIVGQSVGVSSVKLGFFMGMVPAGFILGSYLAGRHGGRLSSSAMVVIGRIATFVGLLIGLTMSALGVMHLSAFFGPCIFIGIGNGLTMPGANAAVLSIRPDLAGTASGLAAALAVAGAALIASLSSAFLTATSSRQTLFYVMLVSACFGLTMAFIVALRERRLR